MITVLLLLLSLGFTVVASDANTCWLKVEPNSVFTVNGLGWYNQNNGSFCRLPLSREKEIAAANPSTWRLSQCPVDARIRFKTDSSQLKLRITPGNDESSRFDMWHMSSVAVSGIDLYIGAPGNQDFWLNTHPKKGSDICDHVFFEKKVCQMREFTLYLPSYTNIKALEIGLDPNAMISAPSDYKHKKPIVIYGTSITQGGCASRCSNSFIGITGRRLNSDVINLGFSGSGNGDELLAELMSQLDASVYIVDPLANMNEYMHRYEKFVNILRSRHPEIPIVLMTEIHFAYEIDDQLESAKKYGLKHKILFETYHKLKESGDKNVYVFDAGAIIKAGGDHPTVDGSHLTDAGFYAIAEKLAPLLENIIKSTGK